MPVTTNTGAKGNPSEWTVMFFFAADNALSPLIVSQVKAIKDAGFQEDTNVLVHFDPSEKDEPTRVYLVNKARKAEQIAAGERATLIGDSTNSFVRNMEEDYIDPLEIQGSRGSSTEAMIAALADPDNVSAEDALRNFIGYSLEQYPAKHYILFLVGHGMVVGNDAFLPDDSNNTAITLQRLGQVLREKFTPEYAQTSLELLALHSCSMSSVEVAYELKGIANHLMACQGLSYVGSWPYRQLLKKLFNTVERAQRPTNGTTATDVDVQELVEKLYYHSLFNSTDFRLAGYSAELSLCSLNPEKVTTLAQPVQELVRVLKQGIADDSSSVKELVQLAHLEAQSYWAESYTDLYDFCNRLRIRSDQRKKALNAIWPQAAASSVEMKNALKPLVELSDACTGVINLLETINDKSDEARAERFQALMVQSDHLGSRYQYSHGLSVYFPWVEPLERAPRNGVNPTVAAISAAAATIAPRTMDNYRQYLFNKEIGEDSWSSFLELYWEKTRRDRREEEDHPQAAAAGASSASGTTTVSTGLPTGPLSVGGLDINASATFGGGDGKPSSATGSDCTCPTIKNYPTSRQKDRVVSMSIGAAQPFKSRPDPGFELNE